MCSRIVTTGFNTLVQHEHSDDDDIIRMPSLEDSMMRSSHSGELHSRISVSPALLIDMLSCLYYAMFNGQAVYGGQAVVDIHYRACYELFPDVILVTNAIRNSLRENPSGQPDDGPIGLSLALSPASSSYTLSKTAITNASFRAKKLPDDIPLIPSDDASKLPTIDEDESSKTKSSKGKHLKKEKGDKTKTRSTSDTSSKINGDSSDGLQVSVTRGQQRTVVDSIEMSAFGKKEGESSTVGSSPYPGKHSSPNVKMSTSVKQSVSNKDLKNTKLSAGHSRNPSAGSGESENYSTDL